MGSPSASRRVVVEVVELVSGGVSGTGGRAIADISVIDTWMHLEQDASSTLIDVRTQAEWAFVGLPDLSRLGKQLVRVEWQTFPDNAIDPAFSKRLTTLLDTTGVSKDANLFFICRSGGRSRMAAAQMMAAGYSNCHNVADGFEGPLDENRHRGGTAGWKAAGLPWVQG